MVKINGGSYTVFNGEFLVVFDGDDGEGLGGVVDEVGEMDLFEAFLDELFVEVG